MWSRAELKARAKAVLKTNYWKSLLVSVIIAIAGGSSSGSSSAGAGNNYNGDSSIDGFLNTPEFYTIIAVVGIIVLIVVLLVLVFRIFLGYPLEVGGRKFFIEGAGGSTDLNYVTYAFEKGNYSNVVKTMFFRGLYNFFWTLLFIIPGIIKHYSYAMVPYILAENPQMDSDRAIELSMIMTKGHKGDMWVLDLSFIGWYLLGTLALFIGVIFVMPYENATKAELYLVLKKNAIENGQCSAYELRLLND